MARQIRPGQLQENVLYNISASFAVSASHEITHEVSSSYAETASFAVTASHALNSGQSITPGTVSGSAQITALGFVTSSATASFVTNSQTSSFVTNSATSSFVNNSATSSFVTNSQTASFAITASDVIFTNITASGNISASGTITANEFNVGTGKIYGDDGYNNYLTFNDSSSLFKIQNKTYVKFDGSSAQREVTINEGTNDIDFVVKGASNNPLLKTDSATNQIGMHGIGTPEADLHLGGNLKTNSNITASGNISSSGTIVASNLSGTNTGDQDLSPYLLSANTASFVINSQTASFVINSQTASFVTNSQTASFVINSQTSSMSVLSSSFALTASHALNGGSGGGTSTFIASGSTSASAAPNTGVVVNHSGSTAFSVIGDVGTLFSVDDSLTGTIFSVNDISGFPVLQAEADGDVYLGKSPQSLYTTAVISSNTANITQSIYGISTSSYAGAFIEYTAFSGSHDARAGSLMAIWSGSAVNFTETTTTDFGNTSNLLMQVAISQSQAQVQSYSTTAGYKIKTIIKAI